MHYYKFNIADWSLGTAHLSLTEEAIYFRLINFYYDSESPIQLETQSVFRRLRMANESVIAQQILDEFFVKTDRGYVHTRCDELLKEYRKTIKNNRSNGAKGGRPSKINASSETETEPSGLFSETQIEPTHNPNQEPLTTNQEPLTSLVITPQAAKHDKPAKKQKEELDYSVWPEQPDNKLFDDWKKVRKAKRAVITQTVIDDFGEEFRKAEKFGYSVNDCLKLAVTKGWQGFKFNWMQNEISKGVTGGAHKQTNQQCGLDPDDTSWADRVFGTGSPAGNPTVESGVQVIEGDFSSVGCSNPRS